MNREMIEARDLIINKIFEKASKDELARAINYSRAVIDAHKEAK